MSELDYILISSKDMLTGMNKDQLSIGLDSEGSEISPDYAQESYAGFKVDVVGSSAPLGTPDLHLEGDFYNGFTIIVGEHEVVITSTDIKTLALESKYGDIFGLTDEHLFEFSQRYVLPIIVKKIKEAFKVWNYGNL